MQDFIADLEYTDLNDEIKRTMRRSARDMVQRMCNKGGNRSDTVDSGRGEQKWHMQKRLLFQSQRLRRI